MESLGERVAGTVVVAFIIYVAGMIFASMANLPKLLNLTPSQTATYSHLMWISETSINAVGWEDIGLTALAIAIVVAGYLGLSGISNNLSSRDDAV